MPASMIPATSTPSRWADLVKQGGYLTPVQREAFERAINLVTECLHQILSQTSPQRSGQFEFDAFVDSLEQDFLHQINVQAANGLHSDVAQTAYWIARQMADQLIKVRQPANLSS
ncbi:DNA-binding protein [Brenneria alni]|uniref:DNA-binding protein n=1 Tax=Brenneria alni TaxID=71656 RepID=A0A421DPZ5_9GAMM|nr:DNA-binding protein [Brenneria alni]RLM25295.1 DNA-binding protein [Brenneria alni]